MGARSFLGGVHDQGQSRIVRQAQGLVGQLQLADQGRRGWIGGPASGVQPQEADIELSMDEPGCLAYQPYIDPNDPARMVIVEEWTGPQALAEHFTTPHFRHVEQVLGQILAQPLSIRKLIAAPS
ncbi:MAG TPA: putative quinol monooxygenase [Nonomuraea sp.]|nr:putative quinol monooxygenase [Nonomuraea sp.]